MVKPIRTCTVDGCTEPLLSKGYCSTHYARWRRNGDPGPAHRLTKKRSRYDSCSVEGCSRPPRAKGMCSLHRRRFLQTGDPGPAELLRRQPDDPVPTCDVDGCDNDLLARGYCIMHYDRWRNTGDPGEPDRRKLQPNQYNECTVEGCERDHYRKGYCNLHYDRVVTRGEPGSPHPADPGSWNLRELVGYSGAHGRVRRKRGSAKRFTCIQCGNQAEEWAYDHNDPDEHQDDRGLAYSSNPDYYKPMCVPCHRAFDTLMRREDWNTAHSLM